MRFRNHLSFAQSLPVHLQVVIWLFHLTGEEAEAERGSDVPNPQPGLWPELGYRVEECKG